MPRHQVVAARVKQKELEREFQRAYKQNLAAEHERIFAGEYEPVVEQKKVSVVFWMPPVNDGWADEVW